MTQEQLKELRGYNEREMYKSAIGLLITLVKNQSVEIAVLLKYIEELKSEKQTKSKRLK